MTAHGEARTQPGAAKQPPVTAYIALGSNLRGPAAQVRAAFDALAGLPGTRLVRRSSLYRNPPAGGLDQPDYVNAVAEIETRLGPRELLEALLGIERARGRVRDYPNAPRTLDLDIVLYGSGVIDEPGLTVPHPRMLERPFVLVPLAEIAPDASIPGAGRAAEAARRVDATRMVRLEEEKP